MNDPTYFALLEACRQRGCPVCRLVQSTVERSLSHLFYESVTDPAVRGRLCRRLGFCRTHAGLLVTARSGDTLGMAIIYHDILGSLLKHLPHETVLASSQNQPDRLLRSLPLSLKTLV